MGNLWEFASGLHAIIDAVEFKSEAPNLLPAQKQLYSAYKNDNTYKMLISCLPNGYITYSSVLWSDRDVPMEGHGGILPPPQCQQNGKKVGHKTDPLTVKKRAL